MSKKRVYAARVKDTGSDPRWDGAWHRIKTNQNTRGEWSMRKGAQAALAIALKQDADLIGHVFTYKIDKAEAPTLETVKIDEWLTGSVVPVMDVPKKYRVQYQDTLRRVALAGARIGEKVPISSSFRTYAEQVKAYNKYLNGGPLAAKPGTSAHEKGLAVDSPNARLNKKLMKQLRKLSVHDDVPSEKWHLTNHHRV